MTDTDENKSKTWVTADWHLGETRMELMGRPFKTADHNDWGIIENANQFVGANDTLIHLGDVISKSSDPACREYYLRLIKEVNGKKILIRGNHDEPFTDEEFALYFDTIVKHGDGVYQTDVGADNETIYLTHYPTRALSNCFNLVGHIHSAWKYQLNMLNVGVDAHHYFPVAVDKIPFHMTAIKEFYDDDVWIAYQEINEQYRGKRGKKGSYFTPQKN